MQVLIVVTHLLGSGHLSRILTIGRAFSTAGHHVTVASGGMPVPHLNYDGIKLVQLAPLRSDGMNFTRLLDQDGQVATHTYFDERHNVLSKTLDALRPDVLITELFPFGRRSLKGEFGALLKHAKDMATPLILGSIRDILAPPSKPSKATFADETIAQYYDGVLVHSDPTLTPLSLSWPVSEPLAKALHYTGFVAPSAPPKHPMKAGLGEVIVSAGGGDVGLKLFEVAIKAALRDQTRTWRILVGGPQAKEHIARLAHVAPSNAVIQAARPDFRQMLNQAAVSVSMCGYNTALDVLQTGVPAVFIPFDAGGEVEQTLRACALSEKPNITVLKDVDLDAERLIVAVQETSKVRTITPKNIGFDGARRSVEIVQNLLDGRTPQ